MKIDPKCLKLVERQVGIEEYSSRVYLAMANWCGLVGYKEAEEFNRKRAAEELVHRDRQMEFLLDCNYPVTLVAVPSPEYKIEVLEDTLTQALIHEQKVTKAIWEIMQCAEDVNDFNTYAFFEGFITEQREEEAIYIDLIDWATHLGLIGSSAPDWAKGMMRAQLNEYLGD